MEHTPIPWRISSHASTRLEGEDGRLVASTGGYATNTDNGEHHDENDANAAFIVQAVNAHQALVETLEAIVTHRGKCFIPEDRTAPHALYEWTERARAALKQARGEEVAS